MTRIRPGAYLVSATVHGLVVAVALYPGFLAPAPGSPEADSSGAPAAGVAATHRVERVDPSPRPTVEPPVPPPVAEREVERPRPEERPSPRPRAAPRATPRPPRTDRSSRTTRALAVPRDPPEPSSERHDSRADPPARPRRSDPTDAPAARSSGDGRRGGEPGILEMPDLSYPEPCRTGGHEGRAVVMVLLGRNGRVLDAVLEGSAGCDRLDGAAVAAALRARYRSSSWSPPSGIWLRVPFAFSLD